MIVVNLNLKDKTPRGREGLRVQHREAGPGGARDRVGEGGEEVQRVGVVLERIEALTGDELKTFSLRFYLFFSGRQDTPLSMKGQSERWKVEENVGFL